MILVIGGSGSGKSAIAERLVAAHPATRRIYLATLQAGDEESRARVARHRAQRAALSMETLERPTDVGAAPIPPGALVLLEDLPNLLANECFGGGDPDRIEEALLALDARACELIVVSGHVFSDGAAHTGETEDWLRRLAALHAFCIAHATQAIEAVCGIPEILKGEGL